MMMHLSSATLKVSIHKKGAEVCSVKNNTGLEFMWQADKQVWARHAPVLFPIVGKLNNNEFIFENKNYLLSQHGFARDMDFETVSETKNSVVLQLKPNDETKKNYPFEFIFEIKYELIGNTLTTSYTVKNPSNEQLFFSVGAHPGFNCPLLPSEKFEDYFLTFENSSYQQTKLNNGLRTYGKNKLNLENNILPISKNLFNNDALVFEDGQINAVSLCSKTSSHKITLQCNNWPFFGIWSPKDCDRFICLEPWFGIADSENHKGQIIDKKGIIPLKPLGEFNCSFLMTFT
jgi:galactose mutarotase-like enzyme